jgi:ATP/maltotriose-dependent transcriptional regulator MalT
LLDESNARTIVLVAPAGFGKTTLASQWLMPRTHGWYRGSSASADVAALSAGLARAAATVVPGAGRRMLERLGIAAAPPATAGTLANMLGEDLAVWPQDAWLGIDDYHFAMTSEASETFVEELLARCPVRLLITSRERPTWATARRMLYGEILEVGRGVLALTHAEARQVLPDRRAEEVAGVHALTEGWPAVIGLASLSNDLVLSEAELPDALYGYCAEELLQRFAPDLQRALCTLALAPSISVELVRALYGREATGIVESGEAGGFLTRGVGGDYDMHPLLRSVLLRKLDEEGSDRADQAMRELTAYLIRAGRWDEAFAVAERDGDSALLEEVIDGALDGMLRENRLETLKSWVAQARTDASSAIIDLADAEVAFREGNQTVALFHATNAAAQLSEAHPRLSQSWFRAGQAAYFQDQSAEARDFCQRARETATSARAEKNALWGLFNAALDLEDRRADDLLREIDRMRPLTPTEQMRIVGGRVFFATRWGGLESALEPVERLAKQIRGTDPMSLSAFLHHYSVGLALAARYERALEVIDEELAVARDFSLDFAIPHALLVRAQAQLGARRFRQAEDTLRTAAQTGDEYIRIAATVLASRVPLYAGHSEKALTLLRQFDQVGSIPSMRAEFLATKALACAAAGRLEESTDASNKALRISETIETSVLAAAAQAAVALQRGAKEGASLAQRAFRVCTSAGNFDSFICAYRAFPALLKEVSAIPELQSSLESVIVRASDVRLAVDSGLRAKAETWALTKREAEILQLIAQGLTNKEIAARLYVAESTVKVHVRHILRKLGVRRRTDAAVRAALTGG